MPSLTLPAANPNVPAFTAPSAGARGRAAAAAADDDADGHGFGQTLDRLRNAGASKAADAAELSVADGGAPHKPRGGGRKSELSAADVMALLAPAAPPVALVPAPVLQSPGAASASGRAGAAGAPIDNVLAQAAQAEQGVKDASAQAAAAATAARTAADGAADAQPDADPLATADAPAPAAAAQEAAKAGKPDSPLDASLRAELAKAVPLSDAVKAPASAPTPSPSVPAQTAAAAPLSPNAGKPAASSSASAAAGATASAANAPAPSTDTAKADASAPLAAASAKLAAASGASADDAAQAASSAGPQALPQLQALVPTSVERQTVTTNTTPLLTVAPPVGSSEWGTAIGHQMIRMSASGQHVAELSLNPAGLGPLKVTLSLGDNQAQAMFVSAHESVRKAVEAALPQLRSTLADQGISLGQASVGTETRQPGQGSAFGQPTPQPRSPGQPDYPGIARQDAIGTAEATTGARQRAASNAGLDTFA